MFQSVAGGTSDQAAQHLARRDQQALIDEPLRVEARYDRLFPAHSKHGIGENR
jgi:hypothetical protein